MSAISGLRILLNEVRVSRVQAQTGLHSEFEASMSYITRSGLKLQ